MLNNRDKIPILENLSKGVTDNSHYTYAHSNKGSIGVLVSYKFYIVKRQQLLGIPSDSVRYELARRTLVRLTADGFLRSTIRKLTTSCLRMQRFVYV